MKAAILFGRPSNWVERNAEAIVATSYILVLIVATRDWLAGLVLQVIA